MFPTADFTALIVKHAKASATLAKKAATVAKVSATHTMASATLTMTSATLTKASATVAKASAMLTIASATVAKTKTWTADPPQALFLFIAKHVYVFAYLAKAHVSVANSVATLANIIATHAEAFASAAMTSANEICCKNKIMQWCAPVISYAPLLPL